MLLPDQRAGHEAGVLALAAADVAEVRPEVINTAAIAETACIKENGNACP